MNGFITWPRDMVDTFPWYKSSPNVLCVYITLLTSASITDSFFAGRKIPRGSVATSAPNLSEYTGLSEKQVRIALDKLESTGNIKRETFGRFTVITIPDFERFNGQTQGRVTAARGQGEGTHAAGNGQHYENVENPENVENVDSSAVQAVLDAWNSIGGSTKKVHSTNSSMLKGINTLISKHGLPDVLAALERARQSEYLTGGDAGWFTLNWFVKPSSESVTNLLNGKYDKSYAKATKQQEDDRPLTDEEKAKIRQAYSEKMMRGDF